jgi:hypothetical protein
LAEDHGADGGSTFRGQAVNLAADELIEQV